MGEETTEWVTGAVAGRILGISADTLWRMKKAGALAPRVFPHCAPRYRRTDIERLAAEADRAGTERLEVGSHRDLPCGLNPGESGSNSTRSSL